MKQVLKFIHISDLHFSKEANCYNIPSAFFDNKFKDVFVDVLKKKFKNQNKYKLKAVYPHSYNSEIFIKLNQKLMDIYQNEYLSTGNNIDFIAITGDIATTADEEDLTVAKSLLSGTKTLETITGIPHDTSLGNNKNTISFYGSSQVLPGNHDRFQIYEDTDFREQGLETFSEVFHELWEKDKRIKMTKSDKCLHIFVDFSLPKDFHDGMYFDHDNNKKLNAVNKYASYLGRGIYTKKIKKELEDLLERISKSALKDKKILFFSHFSLISKKKSLRLINAKMLIDTLKKYHITTYFCGHTHEQDFNTIENSITHICCGSTTGCGDTDHNYSFFTHSIYHDEEDKYILETNPYVYNNKEKSFKKENSTRFTI